MEWLTIIPNLSIGVIAVGALVFVSVKFIETLDKRAEAHELAMKEREDTLRAVEKEVRTEISQHLTASTLAITDATRVMERVIHNLDKK